MSRASIAKFGIGQIIRHRVHAFRGVVFDVDPVFADRARSYAAADMVDARRHEDQPYYYLFAENEKTPCIAYVAEQNLMLDSSNDPIDHPLIEAVFERDESGSYRWRDSLMN